MHGDFSEGSCALRKRSALIATLWSGGDVLFRQGIQFLTLALLARMLAPSDFGMIAMLSLITGVATVLVDGGLSVALIQRQEVTRADEATLFYFNVSIGLLLTLLIVICAPWIAAFYRAPDLITPARIMALGCLLGSLAPVHTALLTRKLDFATQAKASTLATTASGVIVVVLALQGWGVIALALHGVLMAGFMSAALWWLHPWRPHAGFSFQSLRSLTHFGFFQLGASLLDMIYNRLHTPLLGRLFGARDLGLYSQADTLRQMPGNFLGSMVARAALPLFSRNTDDPTLMRRGLELSIRVMTFLMAPIMLGMAVLSDVILTCFFGLHWQDAALPLSILCLASVLYPLHVLNVQVFYALGHAKLVFQLQVAKVLVGLLLLLASLPFGLIGIAWSQVMFSIIALCLNTWHTHRLLNYGSCAQLRECFPPIGAAAVASGLVLLWRYNGLPTLAPMLQLLYGGAVGAIIYLLVAFTFRLKALQDTASLARLIRQPAKHAHENQ